MGIDTYLTVFFWLGIVRIVIFVLVIAGVKYPRKIERSLGGDLVWVCFLKYCTK